MKGEGGKHKLLANLFPYGRPVLSFLSHVDSPSQIGLLKPPSFGFVLLSPLALAGY
jgi:hypothetical protein